MKKAIFLPMLAIFTLIIVGVIAYAFNENSVKERNEIVGEKAAFIIKSITNSEKDYFFVQDSARLAYCDALNNMAQETGMKTCLKNGYTIWDFTPNCNPSDNFDLKFTNYFNENFANYLKQNVKLKELKYKFTRNKDGFSITTESIKIEDKDDKNTIYINYNFNPIFSTKIDSNIDDYTNIINNAKNYLNCTQKGGSIDKCNVETKLSGSRSDNLIKFNIPSIKNPCNLQQIEIKFALQA